MQHLLPLVFASRFNLQKVYQMNTFRIWNILLIITRSPYLQYVNWTAHRRILQHSHQTQLLQVYLWIVELLNTPNEHIWHFPTNHIYFRLFWHICPKTIDGSTVYVCVCARFLSNTTCLGLHTLFIVLTPKKLLQHECNVQCDAE